MMTQAAHATPRTTPFHPESGCPRWLQFLEESMQDAASIHALREWMAACLGDGPNEKALYLHGDVCSGKSTLLSVLVGLTGDENTVCIDFQYINSPFERARIRGKKLVISLSGLPLDCVSCFKSIVSGDTLFGTFKFQKPFEFRPTCSLVFHHNTEPDFERLGEGCRRRMLVVPFRRVFTGNQRDPNLKNTLQEELPAIRAWVEAICP
ncbi:P4 family phage/plasmid primase-like protein [Desulfobotulus alkaliphilus]|uniref:P4 family phage/plasmid primase-like protein n=1 Tax=Desulfobotulus alkaliphilus TaxID=622671 RepID=A0A562RHH5_9BACT|nr:phage/plasmid primase, P4 family [Desulfobotulus alkaliphilus]TWI68515.1 P4 family phage/plasmid primase-like protein [Desulfobotulus alkaliphilus]